MQAYYSYGPSRPLYSGAPDLNWAPSSRVSPSKVAAVVAPPALAPVPAAPRPTAVPTAMAAPRPASVRDMLEASARRWRAKHPGRRAIQVAPGVVEIALSIRVGQKRSSRAAARVAAIPVPQPAPRTAQLPAIAPIGTTVSLGTPATAPAAAITTRELLPIEALRPAADEAAVAVAEPVVEAAPVAVEDTAPEAVEMPAPDVVEAPVAEAVEASVEPEVAEAPVEAVEEAPVETAAETEVEVPAEPAPVEDIAPVVPPAAVEVVVPPAPALREVDWQMLVLSGPAGSGKSSVAFQLGQVLPKAAHIKVEPLRDRAYSTLVGQVIVTLGANPGDTGPLPSAWSGPTTEAREKAIELARDYINDGYLVIVDDVIESAAELKMYLAPVEDLNVRAVTLMPSVDEMERRDKMRPADQRIGTRIADARTAMARQLSVDSVVIDTSEDTVESTAQKILDALAAAE